MPPSYNDLLYSGTTIADLFALVESIVPEPLPKFCPTEIVSHNGQEAWPCGELVIGKCADCEAPLCADCGWIGKDGVFRCDYCDTDARIRELPYWKERHDGAN